MHSRISRIHGFDLKLSLSALNSNKVFLSGCFIESSFGKGGEVLPSPFLQKEKAVKNS